MKSYRVDLRVFYILLTATAVALLLSYFLQENDILRKMLISILVACFVLLIVYISFAPKLFGTFLHFHETNDGFEVDYIDKDGTVKSTDLFNMNELSSFSFFQNRSIIAPQYKFIFRFESKTLFLNLDSGNNVKGVDLQSAEIVERIFSKIRSYNENSKGHFIVRTPSFIASKSGVFLILIFAAFLAVIISQNAHNPKSIVGAAILSGLIIISLIIRRFTELRHIRQNKI